MVFHTFCTFFHIISHYFTLKHSFTFFLTKCKTSYFNLYTSLFTTIRICLDGRPYTILHYIVDLVDGSAEMQTQAYNEIAHMIPTCSRIPILLQLYTNKQSLTNSILSTNLELLYTYGAN